MLKYLVSCHVSAAPPRTDGMSLYILVKSSKYENIVTLLGEDKAEPDIVVAVAGGAVVAASGATVPGNVVPATTADHAV